MKDVATPVGVIGTGHLVSHMIPRLVEGGTSFLVSERSREISARLAARHGVGVSSDNQAIVDECELVILAVRPADALGVLEALRFRPGQTLVSVCAGLPLADLASAVRPARVVLAMPVVAAEFGESATLIHPGDEAVRRLLQPCGPVVAAPSEAAYRQAAAIACYYGWVLALMAETIQWTRANGMDEAGALLLVVQMTRGASTVMRERTAMSPAELVGEVTYPGSFTGRGLAHLNARGAFPPWQEALSLLFPPLNAG